MSHRSKASVALAVLAASLAACAHQTGPLKIDPRQLHLHAGGSKGQFVLSEADYTGLYYKTLDADPHCKTTVTATPRPRKRGEPAHLIISPVRAGSCDVWLFDDHMGRERVSVVVDP